MITQYLINELIVCPKRAIKADRRKMQEENRSLRNNIFLESINKKYKYKMIMRKSSEFSEDFSVGLFLTNANELFSIQKHILLTRYQGPHDSKRELDSDLHHSFHIHEITEKDIREMRYQKPSNKCDCKKFSSFEQAVCYFVENCSIIDLDKVIDDIAYLKFIGSGQTTLF